MSSVSVRDHLFTSLLANSWQKSMQNGSWERSRGTHNREKIGPGTFLGHPMVPQRVREASRERPGGILGHPRRARATPGGSPSDPGTPKRTPGGAQERAEASKIDAKSRRGAKKTCLFHATRSRSIVGAISCRFWSIFGVFAKSANPPKHRKLRCFVRVG